VKNISERDQVTLPCTLLRESSAVWHYQPCCDDFEHGMHLCSNPVDVDIGSHYQIRRNAPGDFNLLITDVTKNMTGIYTCRDRSDHDRILYRYLLNVISEYISLFYYPHQFHCSNLFSLECIRMYYIHTIRYDQSKTVEVRIMKFSLYGSHIPQVFAG